MSGIGTDELPPPPATVNGPFASNLQVIPVIEGPQILVLWSLPTSPDTTHIKLMRKRLNYSVNDTDGTELVNSPIISAPNSYVDLYPDEQRAWCYTAFVRHDCSVSWTADTFVAADQTVIPATTPTGFFYVSRSRGITGATEPVWPTEVGDTVTDGDIIWECLSINPGWVATKKSRGAGFTWDSEYMQRLMFGTVPRVYRNEDAKSTQTKLDTQKDSDYFDAWRAVHEDGLTSRGEFERFLLIFGAALSRMKGAIDFYPRLIDPDECLPQYLPQLAGILGWELSTKSSTAQQRQELLSAVPVYKVKGTSGSMEPLARSAATVANVIVDPMSSHILMSNRINRLSARGVDGLAYTSWAPSVMTVRGDIIIPTSANRTGYYYQVIQAGITDLIEPTWPTTPGDDVTDGAGAVTWRTREFSAPHLTADVSIGATSITVASTAEFEVGKTVNIRDDVTIGGEERVITDIPDSVTLEFSPGLANAYTLANDAKVTPAFDWHDDETGFIWDRPTVDEFDGIDPARVRVSGAILDPSALYSFEFLRIWFILAIGEAVSSAELERLDRLMEQFAPADTTYVVRIEQE